MKNLLFYSIILLFAFSCKKGNDDTPITPQKNKIKTDSAQIFKQFATIPLDLDQNGTNDIVISSVINTSGLCLTSLTATDSIWTLHDDVKIFNQSKMFSLKTDTIKIDSVYHIMTGTNYNGKNTIWTKNKTLAVEMDSVQLYKDNSGLGSFQNGGFLISSFTQYKTNCQPIIGTDGKFYLSDFSIYFGINSGDWLLFQIAEHLYAVNLKKQMPYIILKSGYKIK